MDIKPENIIEAMGHKDPGDSCQGIDCTLLCFGSSIDIDEFLTSQRSMQKKNMQNKYAKILKNTQKNIQNT